jgi:hypothetical protein
MADYALSTLLKNFVTTLGGAAPASDDLGTLLTDINNALATSLTCIQIPTT